MSYKSPIEIIMGQMNVSFEDEICKAVQKAGILVDREELLKALQYDRGQYQKGYNDRDAEIVRCKDCDNKECWGRAGDVVCGIDGTPHRPDWFCADGEVRE